MGGVPKKRHTQAKRNMRRAHLRLEVPSISRCAKCGQETLSHVVCPHCGYYRGREVINVLEKLTKKEKKAREKEIAQKEKETGKQAESATKQELPKDN